MFLFFICLAFLSLPFFLPCWMLPHQFSKKLFTMRIVIICDGYSVKCYFHFMIAIPDDLRSHSFGGSGFPFANRTSPKATVRLPFFFSKNVRFHSNFLAHPSLKILQNFHFLWVYFTCGFVIVDHCYTAYLLATLTYIGSCRVFATSKICSSSVDLLQSQHHCMIRKGVHVTLLYGKYWWSFQGGG